MNILLTMLAGFIAISESQNNLRSATIAPTTKLEQQKELLICKKTIQIAANNQFFTTNIPSSDYFMIRQGHNPLNNTEIESNKLCSEAINVFHDVQCERNTQLNIRDIAFMNTLHRQITATNNQDY